MHYQEVRLRPLKYARDFMFILFFDFFPFDSLGAVSENPCPNIRGVRFIVYPVYRGTTVYGHIDNVAKIGHTQCSWLTPQLADQWQ